jgi:hypothetical protein
MMKQLKINKKKGKEMLTQIGLHHTFGVRFL